MIAFNPGDHVADWTLVSLIGTGGTSQIYEVHGPDGQVGALKVLCSARSHAAHQRFAREAEVLQRLEHPHIVRLLDHDLQADPPWMVQQLAGGRSLASWVRRPARPLDAVLQVVEDVVGALHAVHTAGLCHRDVKPDNIMIDENRTLLLDFGSAQAPDGEALTLGSAPPGTPHYAPPEWFAGESRPALHDAYALGVMCFELLCGAPAHPDVLGAPRTVALDPGPAFPPDVRQLVRALTHPSADERMPLTLAARRIQAARSQAHTLATVAPSATHIPTLTPALVGRYRLLEEVGRGGMGQVWKAWDPDLKRHVAVKLLHGGASASQDAQKRFLREARALARLDHDGLVRVLDLGADDVAPYFVMELVNGPTLAARLREGPLPEAHALRIASRVAEALDHAHQNGVIHRDVKPANVLLEEGITPRLSDFGIARELHAEGTALTVDGQLIGTPAYMAPEQVRGEPAGPASDVWALGALLYECVAGAPPYRGEHPAQVLYQMLNTPLPDLRRVAPQASEGVTKLCGAAMRQHAEERPTMAELCTELRRLSRGEPITLAGPSVSSQVRWWWTRWSVWVRTAGVATGIVVLVGAGGLGVQSWTEHAEATRVERDAELHRVALMPRVQALWDAGEDDEADALLTGFLQVAEHRGTRATATTWMSRAEHHEADNRVDDAINAYGRAYVAHEDPHVQRGALRELVRLFASQHNWTAQQAALHHYDELGGDAESVRDHRRTMYLALRRVDAALATSDDPATRVVADLIQHATKTEHHEVMAAWAHRDELLLLLHGDEHVVRTPKTPTLAPATRVALEGTFDTWRYAGETAQGEALLSTYHRNRVTLHGMRDEARVLTSWRGSFVHDSVVVDLDGDGVHTAYFAEGAYDRQLSAVTDGVFERFTPSEQVDNVQSDVRAVTVVDLDDDGKPELLVAPTAWGAYDLRLLRPAPDDEHLEQVSRLKVGESTSVLPFRWGDTNAAAIKLTGESPSRQYYPEPPHLGTPLGVYLVTLHEGELVLSERLADVEAVGLHVGDVNNDGLQDLLVSRRDDSDLLLQQPDGTFITRTLGGLMVTGAVDVDNDGDDEVLGYHWRQGKPSTWVLGSGDTPLPQRHLDLPHTQSAPPKGDAMLREGWTRAERLVSLGLTQAAHDELQSLESLAAPAWRAHLQLRRGDLLADLQDTMPAIDAWTQATLGPQPAEPAFERLAVRYMALERINDAMEVAQRARALGFDGPWLATVPSTAPAERHLVEDGEVDEGWALHNTLAMRSVASGIAVEGSTTKLMDRWVEWQGGPVSIELHTTPRWSGYSAALTVEMRAQDSERLALGVGYDSGSGGGIANAGPRCYSPNGSTAPILSRRRTVLARPDQALPLRIRVDVDPLDGTGSCEQALEGKTTLVSLNAAMKKGPRFTPGVYRLVVRLESSVGSGWFAGDLNKITVRGLQTVDAEYPPTPMRHALLRSTLVLDDVPSHDHLTRALALHALGRTEAANDAMIAYITHAETPPWQALLRGRDGRFLEVAAGQIDDAWPEVFTDAWRLDLGSLGDTPPVLGALRNHLTDLDQVSMDDVDIESRCMLLVRRAVALRVHDSLAAAERHAQRALQHCPDYAGAAQLELAHIHLAQDNPAEALADLRKAVAQTTTPDLLMDRLRVLPTLAALRQHPDWPAFVSMH